MDAIHNHFDNHYQEFKVKGKEKILPVEKLQDMAVNTGKITPVIAKKILEENGLIVTPEQAIAIAGLLYKLVCWSRG